MSDMDRPSIEIFRPAGNRWQRLLRRPSRMAVRIYLIGLVQFLVVAAVLEVQHHAHDAERRAQLAEAGRPAPPWEGHGRFVAEDLTRVSGDPARLGAEVTRVANAFQWNVTLRSSTGDVLAQATPPGPQPFGTVIQKVSVPMHDGPAATLEFVPRLRWNGRMRGDNGDGPPVDGMPGPTEPRMREGGPPFQPYQPKGPPIGLAAIAVLFVVGVSSWLTARSFARPLAKLARAARRFGKGELESRARMDREDEIGIVAKSFDDMADRVAALLTAERELLANVSHELRTPLARIRVALDLANELDDPKAAKETFSDIAQDLAELERIVDDVLASARLALSTEGPRSAGSGGMPIRSEEVDSRSLLDRSIARFRSRNPARSLGITLPSSLPPIAGDAMLLRRVLDNLLDNAHKYTESAEGKVSLTAHAEDDVVVITVEDEGIGIAKEDLARLGEPFFRADRSRARATGGLGLGLTLARRVVETHHGTLAITSTLGKGTLATVRLPVIGGI